MRPTITRRGFLAASAAIAATTSLPRLAFGQSAPLSLTATTRVLEIDGRAATVYGLTNAAGRPGLILDPGQQFRQGYRVWKSMGETREHTGNKRRASSCSIPESHLEKLQRDHPDPNAIPLQFRVDLTNSLDVETIIHWHGQLPPNAQDGVPDLPMPLMKTGEMRSFDYAPNPGTHWMHSHVPVQEMNLLAAPLIVRSAQDVTADRQEVVMFLHDFSFRPAQEVLAEITGGMPGHDMSAMAGADTGAMDMGAMDMGAMVMDLNDFNFDAYLVNDRTLADPEVIAVEKAGRILLRVINAAAATSFWIDTGGVPARLVAVDGHAIVPLPGTRFGMAMGQRLDIEIDLPGDGAFPVLALREGARERTGLILATTGAGVCRIDGMAEADSPAFDRDMAQELLLQAANPLAARPVDRTQGNRVWLRRWLSS